MRKNSKEYLTAFLFTVLALLGIIAISMLVYLFYLKWGISGGFVIILLIFFAAIIFSSVFDWLMIKKTMDTIREQSTEEERKIVREVINGKWDNGQERIKKLRSAGYDTERIQRVVNMMLKEPIASNKIIEDDDDWSDF